MKDIEQVKASCMDCGKLYEGFGLDMVLSNEEWLIINPNKYGLLCVQCIVNRASKIESVIAVAATLLNQRVNDEPSVATESDSSNDAGNPKKEPKELNPLAEEVLKQVFEKHYKDYYSFDYWVKNIEFGKDLIKAMIEMYSKGHEAGHQKN